MSHGILLFAGGLLSGVILTYLTWRGCALYRAISILRKRAPR